MRAADVMKLVTSGAVKPEAEIAVELGFPPFKVTLRLKAGDIQKLALDKRTVSEVLRRCFVQRRIFYVPFDAEGREYSIGSAVEIANELRAVQARVSDAGANAALLTLLARWENISVDARQKLQGTGQLTDILREYRVKSLPIVEALIAMLPADSPDRHDAEDKVEGTKKSLPGPDLALVSDAWRLTDIH
ncbi:MAG: hypothetical protein GEV13_15660 [Rhodospirillales bacterium]|nr:hypothetical protein [Rhodospirillales bacterium]